MRMVTSGRRLLGSGPRLGGRAGVLGTPGAMICQRNDARPLALRSRQLLCIKGRLYEPFSAKWFLELSAHAAWNRSILSASLNSKRRASRGDPSLSG
jgi:hypothetical protein